MFENYKDVVTVDELAKMLNIGRNTAYELVRSGMVSSLRIGRQIRISKQAVICADQLVKQIQLSGGTNTDTTTLFNFLSGGINGVDNLSYTVDSTFKTPAPSGMTNAIQLGVPFYVTVQGRASIGGFWDLSLFHVNIAARGAGVSERYWK